MSEQIGAIYGTLVPSLSESADIQEAFRLYHYGAPSGTGPGEYDPTNSNAGNLVNPSIAYTLNSLQSQITSISGSLGVQATNWGSKGVIVTASAPNTLYQLSVGANGTFLSADSTASGGLSWQTAPVTLTNTVTLTNKTLTAPKISSASFLGDSNGNELISFPSTVASAVNEITVTNAATGNKPTISATGGDTNITLNLVSKGTGTVQVGGIDVVSVSGTQTLTNKTLTAPVVSQAYITDNVTFEGSTNDDFETTLGVIDPTSDRNINFPNASGTVALTANKLSDFASTTSAELASVLSDETGTGSVVLSAGPTISAPSLTLSTTPSTTDARISWDTTYKQIQVGTGSATVNFPTLVVNTTAKVANYVLTAGDVNTFIQVNGAYQIQLDSALSVLPVGTQIHIVGLTTGVSVVATGSVLPTLLSTPGAKLRTTNSMATLIKLSASASAGSASTWLLTGDLSA